MPSCVTLSFTTPRGRSRHTARAVRDRVDRSRRSGNDIQLGQNGHCLCAMQRHTHMGQGIMRSGGGPERTRISDLYRVKEEKDLSDQCDEM
jgi:hypothetical protein